MMNKHRHSIRLKGYDYSRTGLYFITICTGGKECFLGNISDNKIKLTSIGDVAVKFWNKIPEHTDNVILDEFIIMPNHVHGIIIIDNYRRGVQLNAPTTNANKLNRSREYIKNNPLKWDIDTENTVNKQSSIIKL